MDQNTSTYIQITAATRRVIERQTTQWQSVYKQAPDMVDPRTFYDVAMGAYLVWAELNGVQHMENDRTALLEMVSQIKKPT